MEGLSGTLGLATWALLRRHGLYDGMATALRRQLWLGQSNGGSDECQDFGGAQRFDAGKTYKAVLISATLQKTLGVRQRGSVIEGKTNTVCCSSDGNDATGRPLGGAVADHEEVVVVAHELDRGGQECSHLGSALSNEFRSCRLELGDERLELLGRREGGSDCWSRGLHGEFP